MTFFEHIHPQLQRNGTFVIDTTLPKPGPYQVFADFFPSGGTPQVVQKAFVTAGYSGTLAAARAHLTPDPSPVKTVGNTRLRLSSSGYISGFKQQLTFTLDDVGGGPIKDLQEYLGA